MLSFEDWYDSIGHRREDEIGDWLCRMPDGVWVDEIELDTDAWVHEQLESMYECSYGEYIDRCYDEWKDNQL